jgi:hypothetical protein
VAEKAGVALQASTRSSNALLPEVLSLPCMNATLGGRWPSFTSTASFVLRDNVRSASPSQPAETGPGPAPVHWQLH